MHLAWGFGFLFGCVRFGPPLRALAHLARRRPRRERRAPAARRRVRGQLVPAHRGRGLRGPLAGAVHRRRGRRGRAHDPARAARPRPAARPLPRAGPRGVRGAALLLRACSARAPAGDAALAARVLAAAAAGRRRLAARPASALPRVRRACGAAPQAHHPGRAPGLPHLRAHAPPRPPAGAPRRRPARGLLPAARAARPDRRGRTPTWPPTSLARATCCRSRCRSCATPTSPTRPRPPSRAWNGERTVLSVGRLETEKNPLLLADVLARLEPRKATGGS